MSLALMYVRSVNYAILVLSLALVACDAGQTVEERRPGPFSRVYFLNLEEARVSGEAQHVVSQDDSCAEISKLTICASVTGEMIDLVVQNLGDETVEVMWGSARYVDEFGRERTAEPYFLEDPTNHRSVLRAGELIGRSVVPTEKRYYRDSRSGEGYEYVEALLPWDSESISAPAAEARIAELHQQRKPVKVLLPIRMGATDHTFELTLRLSKRKFALPSPRPLSE